MSKLTHITPIFIIIFVAFLAFLGISYIPKENTLDGYVKEGFVSTTRASDCRCLPGYIPSNTIQSEYGGEFQNYMGSIAFIPFRSKQKHWVPDCRMCGIDICNSSISKNVNISTWESRRFGSRFTCDMLNKAKEETKKIDGGFFCQNLSNSDKRMACY